MNFSKQRELILHALAQNPIHPTADKLYELIRPFMPTISLATVYRNLNRLVDNGIIRKISGLDGSVHYDHCVEKHYHFICTCCNKVYDVPYDVAQDLEQKLKSLTGLEAQSSDLTFKGICPVCQKSKKGD